MPRYDRPVQRGADGGSADDTAAGADADTATGHSVGRHPGASIGHVDVDRIARIGYVIAALGLLAAAVLFAVAGAHRNAQLDDLHAHGVEVTLTVTSCLGQLGGSGSNAAGYTCHATFRLGGRRYDVILPTEADQSGHPVHDVVAGDDPTLIITPHQLATERASIAVYILPAVLFVLALGAALGFFRLRRRASRAAATPEG